MKPAPQPPFTKDCFEVFEAKMKALEERRMRDFNAFLSDLERKRA